MGTTLWQCHVGTDYPSMAETSADPASAVPADTLAPRVKGSWLPKGRPLGVANKRSIQQRAFAERVCYGQDRSPAGRKKFEEHISAQLFAGKLPHAVYQVIIFYLFGKPTEHVEVKDTTDETLRELSIEELRARAQMVANSLPIIDTVAVRPQLAAPLARPADYTPIPAIEDEHEM